MTNSLRSLKFVALLGLLVTIMISCNKRQDPRKGKMPVPTKELIVGTWQVDDILFNFDIPKDALGSGSPKIPTGTSLFDVAPLIGVGLGAETGIGVILSKLNTYTFNADGTYSFENPIDERPITFLFSGIATKGRYDFTIDNRVVRLLSDSLEQQPHWINDYAENTLELNFNLEVGSDEIPMLIQLKRQESGGDLDAENAAIQGKWREKDIQFAMTLTQSMSGLPIDLNEGSSLIELAPLLGTALGQPQLGSLLEFSVLTEFDFDGNSYEINNPLNPVIPAFILPDAGTEGSFVLEGRSDALFLPMIPEGGDNPALFPINHISEDEISFLFFLDIPGVAELPFNMILKKTGSGADLGQQAQWLNYAWTQKDLQVAVDVPKDALGVEIPAGTSLPQLIQIPGVASQLDDEILLGIGAMESSVYSFNDDGTYSFLNPILGEEVVNTLFSVAKGAGQWSLVGNEEVALTLVPEGGASPDVHTIKVTEEEVTIGVSIEVDGNDLPLNLILKKMDGFDPQLLSGSWEQEDLQLAMTIPKDLSGFPMDIPEGFSLVDNASDLAAVTGEPLLGLLLPASQNTVYVFDDDNYIFANPAGDLILDPLLGALKNPGAVEMTNNHTALKLTPDGGSAELHSIKKLTGTELEIGIAIDFGLPLDIPVTVVLKKKDPLTTAWLAGQWSQQDLVLAVPIPANELFPGQPAIDAGDSFVHPSTDFEAVLNALDGANSNQLYPLLSAMEVTQYEFKSDQTFEFTNPAPSPINTIAIGALFSEGIAPGTWEFKGGGGLVNLSSAAGDVDHIIDPLGQDMGKIVTNLDISGEKIPVVIVLKK